MSRWLTPLALLFVFSPARPNTADIVSPNDNTRTAGTLANGVLTSWFGLVVLFAATWGLVHHGLGGLRHYVWDFGVAMEPGTRDIVAWATLIGSVVLTIVIWGIALWLR